MIATKIPYDITWGPDSQVFAQIETLRGKSPQKGKFGIILEAVKWTGSGDIRVKDAFGNELFSGSTAAEPSRIHSTLPKITVAAPLQITVTSGSTGAVYFYGRVL